MTPTLFAKGTDRCIDLRAFTELAPETSAEWRAAYARGMGSGPLLFAMPDGMWSRDKDRETQSAVRLDETWERKAELHAPPELDRLIEGENQNVFDILVAQLRSPVGIIPFVGAGLSVPLGFPGWPAFLSEAAAFHRTPEKVLDLVKGQKLIEAASLLGESNADRFQRLVEKWFGAPVTDEQVRRGPVSLLPLLCKGPTITTNFDRVLETAFQVAGSKFDRPITALEPDNIIRAMHRNEHVLIKMHGDALDRSARVFTGFEYKQQYGSTEGTKQGDTRARIPMLARIMFTNRPLLFLGCSLDKDQTLDVLGELHRELPGVTHYAIIAADYSIEKLRQRRDELGDYGIIPLWFSPGDFVRIETMLEQLLHETSTRLIWRNPKPSGAIPSPRKPAKPSVASGAPAISRPPDYITRLTRRMAERLGRGELAFFLGAAVHLGSLPSAREFYDSLSLDYGVSPDHGRGEVAQYLIDREGKAQAWAAAKQKLTPNPRSRDPENAVVCDFLADLPALLRGGGRAAVAEQWFLTTNYDVVMEEGLTARGEAFHLLSHQVDGEHDGRFAHRDLDGSVRIIERPDNVRRLGDTASVIVKLDGGISWDPNIPETVAISPLDFSMSSGRLLTALPAAVREVLRTRSLLVLGSSLRDAHIQRVVRWSAGNLRAMKTWAVMWQPETTAAQFWSAAGVEIVDCDLREFIGELKSQLERIMANV
jgi:hypothetical protein